MKRQVVAIRDKQVNAYGQPIFTQSIGQAIRVFTDEVNRSAADNTMYQHPEDFELFHLAEYDETTGQFENLKLPQQIAVASNVAIRGEK